jgi:hypothetical protein
MGIVYNVGAILAYVTSGFAADALGRRSGRVNSVLFTSGTI